MKEGEECHRRAFYHYWRCSYLENVLLSPMHTIKFSKQKTLTGSSVGADVVDDVRIMHGTNELSGIEL